MAKPGDNKVDVDMVPLIDVVVLNLLFIIIVGDITQSTTAVQMRLPPADQAQRDGLITKGRVVVQLQAQANGQYSAVVDGKSYALSASGKNAEMINDLRELAKTRAAWDPTQLTANSQPKYPVKLRIPKDCPMNWVQLVSTQLAAAGLEEVHYAADPNTN